MKFKILFIFRQVHSKCAYRYLKSLIFCGIGMLGFKTSIIFYDILSLKTLSD